ncbi:MAG: YceD family protein [Lawsonibacter sp.]
MRLDLREVIHVPDARKPFQFQLDLSDLEFYGRKPIVRPVFVQGCVTNHAGALVLEGSATSELDLVCDRCGKAFSREKVVPLDYLVAQELEDEENVDILLLEGTQLDLGQAVTEAFVLAMDTKNLCSDDCKGLCAKCGADLNNGPCGCKPEVDPRLAVLAQLLDKETE